MDLNNFIDRQNPQIGKIIVTYTSMTNETPKINARGRSRFGFSSHRDKANGVPPSYGPNAASKAAK